MLVFSYLQTTDTKAFPIKCKCTIQDHGEIMGADISEGIITGVARDNPHREIGDWNHANEKGGLRSGRPGGVSMDEKIRFNNYRATMRKNWVESI